MDYWHDLLTEKSWKVLQELKGKFPFILIGGWAVYLWARTQKSRDIDIIVDLQTLATIKKGYDVHKNDNLNKYEIKREEIDIDMYVPYYSKLCIPLERVAAEMIEGFSAAKLEDLLALKQGAELDRGKSVKGEKDRIDIVSMLFNCTIDLKMYAQLCKEHQLESFISRLKSLVQNFKDFNALRVTPRELKIKKEHVLHKLRAI